MKSLTPIVRNNKRPLFLIAVILVILVAIFVGRNLTTSTTVLGDNKVQLKDAKSQKEINHELQVPIKNSKGEEVTKIKYQIQNAEIRDEILVKGKRATAVSGRVFLILNIKLINDYNRAIEVNTKDFIRLSVGDSKELFAASIHNDPLTLQPLSVQNSRIGFAINESEKNIKLSIGEIAGEKTTLDLNF